MANSEPVTIVWVPAVARINALLEVILGDLNLLGCKVVVVCKWLES